MAYSYLFFRPARLPLAPGDLDADSALPLNDAAEIQAALARVLPQLVWDGEEGRGEWDGHWLEFHTRSDETMTLSLRCSLRADYAPLVQRLCDELGWLAFDEGPRCFQPGRAPMPA
jgi:hypothetical protein